MNMNSRIITSQRLKLKQSLLASKKQAIVVDIVDELNQPVSGINYKISN